jgi:hypothetical protein
MMLVTRILGHGQASYIRHGDRGPPFTFPLYHWRRSAPTNPWSLKGELIVK